MAPSVGLYLAQLYFDGYNKKQARLVEGLNHQVEGQQPNFQAEQNEPPHKKPKTNNGQENIDVLLFLKLDIVIK